ncbi:MAG TPA: hypothetical protein VGH71_07520 [Gammaproteobacteria bacterium]|jgi:hypothetical protein
MPRILSKALFAAALAVLLTACNKAPAPPAASSPPSVAAPKAAAAPAVVTYDCHSAQKSRDIFVRFDADGTVNMGEDKAGLKPIGEVVTFDKSGVASWSEKLPNGSETNRFNRSTGEWDWQMLQANGEVFDQASYACKAI